MIVEWLLYGGDDSKSDEQKRWRLGGSTLGRRFVCKDCEGGAEQLFHDYFADNLVFMMPHFNTTIECKEIWWMWPLHLILGLDRLLTSLSP